MAAAQRKSRPFALASPDGGGRLARIEAALGADGARWVRSLVEAINPRGQRDAAIRRAAALLGPAAPSARAKQLAMELQRYVSGAWARERALPCPPPSASALRKELFIVARLTGGDGLSWRRLLAIIEGR